MQGLWIGECDRKQSYMDHEMSPDSIFNRLLYHHEMASFKIFKCFFLLLLLMNRNKTFPPNITGPVTTFPNFHWLCLPLDLLYSGEEGYVCGCQCPAVLDPGGWSFTWFELPEIGAGI